jgi:hypothetical protein
MIFERFPEFWNMALPIVGFKHLQQEMYLANLWFVWQLPLSLLKTAQGHPMLSFLSLVCSQLELISCPRQDWGRTLRQSVLLGSRHQFEFSKSSMSESNHAQRDKTKSLNGKCVWWVCRIVFSYWLKCLGYSLFKWSPLIPSNKDLVPAPLSAPT